jgi:hypothetical protein
MVVPLNEKLLPTVSKLERAMIRLALRDHHGNLVARSRARHLAQRPVPQTPAPRFVNPFTGWMTRTSRKLTGSTNADGCATLARQNESFSLSRRALGRMLPGLFFHGTRGMDRPWSVPAATAAGR